MLNNIHRKIINRVYPLPLHSYDCTLTIMPVTKLPKFSRAVWVKPGTCPKFAIIAVVISANPAVPPADVIPLMAGVATILAIGGLRIMQAMGVHKYGEMNVETDWRGPANQHLRPDVTKERREHLNLLI